MANDDKVVPRSDKAKAAAPDLSDERLNPNFTFNVDNLTTYDAFGMGGAAIKDLRQPIALALMLRHTVFHRYSLLQRWLTCA
ncbi:hypothetical protein [Loktanella sp. S4079]|uniref:hypothetical protein n=1 Tax=Loktanella sp. S4079 TaxID=579483 RepID=UPI0005FA7FBB|nr:hypothetical protein [Loktanella sp. S4079]KJZ20570.1 hypothetical protein TW80_07265 [Loktanella sp. S4079]